MKVIKFSDNRTQIFYLIHSDKTPESETPKCLVPRSGIEPPSTEAPVLQTGDPTMDLVARDS